MKTSTIFALALISISAISTVASADPIPMKCTDNRFVMSVPAASDHAAVADVIYSAFEIVSDSASQDGSEIVVATSVAADADVEFAVGQLLNLGVAVDCDAMADADPRLSGSN
jgi:hypothetical protein